MLISDLEPPGHSCWSLYMLGRSRSIPGCKDLGFEGTLNMAPCLEGSGYINPNTGVWAC